MDVGDQEKTTATHISTGSPPPLAGPIGSYGSWPRGVTPDPGPPPWPTMIGG